MRHRPNTPGLFDWEDTEPQEPCDHVIQVAFDSGADTVFSYQVPTSLWPIQPGQRVQVPLGRNNKPHIGFCVGTDLRQDGSTPKDSEARSFKLKRIRSVLDTSPLLDSQLMELARWISTYYVCPLGQVLGAMVPAAVKRSAGIRTERFVYLTEEATQQGDRLRGKKQKQIFSALLTQQALSPETAVSLNSIKADCDCTSQPIKRLAEQRLIRFDTRSVFSSLPPLPEGLLVQESQDIVPNEDQTAALNHLHDQIHSSHFGVTLLHGITGSGKTEVYIRAIQKVLALGKGAIVLVPEIALTAQTVQRFKVRFDRVAVMHSGLNAPQRHAQWQSIRSGEAKVVVGARSAVFAPLPNLGMIVVDEEHDNSYKQDTVPRYHARNLAIKRAALADAHCLLGSATPSLETLVNCQIRESFTLVRLPRRVNQLSDPAMRLIDLRKEPLTRAGFNLISAALKDHLQQSLDKKEQAILLLNRRGYSHVIFCPACHHLLQCRNCDVTLTYHKSSHSHDVPASNRHHTEGLATCHYCAAQTLVPKRCPLCGKGLIMAGLGSQRLEEELKSQFPGARIARMDSDAMAGKDYHGTLQAFGQGRIDILAGTQMLAKGLHFPNVTLVGIISADTALFLPDFRANERTFQLISQVAGRTGRSIKSGTVVVQTVFPDQQAIQFARQHDFEGFARAELQQRKDCHLPPFWRMATIDLRDERYERLEAAARQLRERIDHTLAACALTAAQVRGPLPPVISRIQRSHRLQIVIQTPDAASMQTLFASLRNQAPIRPKVKTIIDIDPVNLL